MKKIISLVLVLVFTLCMFAGCKPKIEDTEEYKMIEMTVEDWERKNYGRWTYEITDAQYIKNLQISDYDFHLIIETEDGKYHKASMDNCLSRAASYDMYIVVTRTYVKDGDKSDIILFYLSKKGSEKLDEEVEKEVEKLK